MWAPWRWCHLNGTQGHLEPGQQCAQAREGARWSSIREKSQIVGRKWGGVHRDRLRCPGRGAGRDRKAHLKLLGNTAARIDNTGEDGRSMTICAYQGRRAQSPAQGPEGRCLLLLLLCLGAGDGELSLRSNRTSRSLQETQYFQCDTNSASSTCQRAEELEFKASLEYVGDFISLQQPQAFTWAGDA